MAELRPIMTLPPEIHLTIAEKLSFPENIHLKITNRYFYNLIKPPSHDELLEAELSPYARVCNLFACMDCVRLLPASNFSDTMRKKKKGKSGQERHRRFCIQCCMHPKAKTGRYCRGSRIVVNGQVQVICIICNRLKKGVADGSVDRCEDCFNKWKNRPTDRPTGTKARRAAHRTIGYRGSLLDLLDLDAAESRRGYNSDFDEWNDKDYDRDSNGSLPEDWTLYVDDDVNWSD